jgi:cytochrome c-type biogenesis protein CcmH/NrfG
MRNIVMKTFRKFLIPVLVIVPVLFAVGCGQSEEIPLDETEAYRQAVADFYMSIGASQTDEARFAFNKMNDVAQAFPNEAAAWANLGVYAMRQGNYDLAEDRFARARDLIPDNPDILFLSSIMESRRGNISSSIEFLREGVQADPDHVRMLFALAAELEREDDVANADEIKETLTRLQGLIPENQVVILELARVAAKEQDEASARRYLDKLDELSGTWTTENREQLREAYEILDDGDFSELLFELSFLRSGLETQSVFQDDLLAVQLPPTDIGYLITRFLYLPQPEVTVAAADLDMTLERQLLDLPESDAVWVKGVTLLEEAPPFPVAISGGEVVVDNEVRLPFPGNTDGRLPLNAFTEIDYNYNFRNDIAVAGSEGFRLYHQNEDETFIDVTPRLGLRSSSVNGSYNGVWAFDMDMDGDLDLLLARTDGDPVVLRNNGDGTFTEMDSFPGSGTVIDFRWADLDGDGVPEAIILNSGGDLLVYRNLRGGRFASPEKIAEGRAAIVIADLDANGKFDILSLDETGNIHQTWLSERYKEWKEETLVESGGESFTAGGVHLLSGDIDNNGALDLILTTRERSVLWLGDENRRPVRYESDLPGGITSLFDVDGNERLDILGIDGDHRPFFLKNEGTKIYFARSIRARASGLEGDQRINSFGIGGEMEVRSGLLYQKQLISSPIVHFGLGEYEEAQMLRIVWPNGSVQAEFAELGMGATIFNEQILKGSCPWLFTSDGEEVHFITDILWRSPLGLRINALETAGVEQTLDRVRIPSDKINSVDGVYDVRITAELWETHFFDYVSLVSVDHPVGTEIFIDERFAFPAPDLSTQLMTVPEPVARVTNDQGHDLTAKVSQVDGQYIRPFTKTAYQGLTEEHSIVIELNDSAEENPAEWLLLSGWLRPTDSSINLALSQGSIAPPQGLHVQVREGNSEWRTLHENYGFPAGKLKTILIDLEDAFHGNAGRQVKLTTTTEIYWDGIFQAGKLDNALIMETDLEPLKADLRYRGFSEWYRPDENSPKLANYGFIAGTNQRWRDLEGFHTRFGDVSKLLAEIDDRYVIMNAGDELVLNFRAIDGPPEGYQRSYVFVSDGWEKDGDYNTEASATVLPLPYHGQQEYVFTGEETLFNDPVFRRFPEDWINYHTRYITPHNFRNTLVFE